MTSTKHNVCLHQALRTFFLAFVLLATLAAPAALSSSANPMIHQQGLDILDGQGKKIKLRSVNLAPWLNFEGYLLGGSLLTKQSRIIESLIHLIGKDATDRLTTELRQELVTREDIDQIAAQKFNCVRVPVNFRQIDGAAAPGWAMLDQLAQWCSEDHIYMIIDLHAAPGGQSNLSTADPEGPGLWKSKPMQDATVELWRRIATHFKNNTTVAGYDLLNEPLSDDPYYVFELYKRIIKEVRTVDENHMVVVEGLKLASDFTPFYKPIDRNMVYSFHMYTWFGDDRQKKLAVYGGIAHEQKVPMWVGEFGENTYDMIDSTIKMFSSSDFIVGCSFWTWKRASGKYPNLNVIQVPPDWKATMDWIGNPFKKRPSQEDGVEGLQQLIKAASIKNCVADKKMTDILQQY